MEQRQKEAKVNAARRKRGLLGRRTHHRHGYGGQNDGEEEMSGRRRQRHQDEPAIAAAGALTDRAVPSSGLPADPGAPTG